MDEHTDLTAEPNTARQGEITDHKHAEEAQRENEERLPLAPDNLPRRDRPVLLGTVLLSLAIFLLDSLTPVGLVVWPLYLIPLMLSSRTRERRYPPILAALCTVLVVLGLFSPLPESLQEELLGRTLGIGVLWFTAVLLVRRMRVEGRLREQEGLLAESQRIARIGNWRYYLTGRITWSDEMYRIYGRSPDTFTPNADSFRNVIHPEDRAAMQAWIEGCVAGEKPGELEYRAVLPDGRVRIIKVRGDLRCDSDGRPAYIAATSQDITEQRQAEEALQAVEDRLRRGRMGTFDWDIAHDRITWSRGLEVLFGGPGQFSGTYETFAQRVHPEDLPGVNAEIARCMAARDSYAREYRVVWPDGSVHWIAGQGEFTFSDAGQAVGMRGVVLDITERKRVEAALRESEDRYRDLVENSLDLLCTHDLEGQVLSCNPAPARILGYTVKEILQKSMRDLLAPERRDKFNEYLARIKKDGIAEGLMLVITRTGERRVWEYRNTLRTEGVPVPIVRGMAHDITERKRAEAALRESEEKYRGLFERMSSGVAVYRAIGDGEDFVFVEFNHAAEEIEHIGRQSVIGKRVTEVFPGVKKFGLFGVFQRVWRTGKSEYAQAASYLDDRVPGTWRENWVYRLPDDKIVAVYNDVTERKRAEEALRISEDKFACIFRSSPNAIVLTTVAEGRFLEVNDEFTRLTGYARDEVLGRSVFDLGVGSDPTARKQLVSLLDQQGGVREFEWNMLSKYGELRSIVFSGEKIELGGQPCLVCIWRDITERLRALELLRRQALMLENMDDAVIVVDQDYNITDWNPAATRMYGYEKTEVLGRNVSCLHPPEAAESQLRSIRTELQSAGRFDGELAALRKDGARFMVRAVIVPFRNEHGTQIGIIGVSRDISERKRAEQALRDSEEKYRILFESNPQPMWVYHVQSLRFLAVNQAAIRHYGYTREEFLAMTLRDIRPPEDIPTMEQSALHSPSHDRAGTWRHRTKDGKTIYVDITDCRVNFEGQTASLVLANDITERQFLEDELRRGQKMEAVGRLAGGVAHDFNNILTAIQMNGSLLAGGLVPPDRLQEKARDILASAERGAALTKQLLAFGQKQVLSPRILDLNEMLRGLSFFMRGIIPENISVTASLCSTLGFVKADPHQLDNVIINLVINARNAMPRGGRLIIETSNVYASEESDAITRIMRPGRYVMVAVSDTGVGMDPATQARIFEPFFTTRRNDGGTGLGLAMSYGTVKQSGGYLLVHSAKGQGTTFKVFLPIVDAEPTAVAAAAEPISNRGRGQTILLVEDDDMVRNSAAEFLSAYGYVVIEARSGPEALQLAMSRPSDIAAVVTDMVMPGIDGREVVEILRQLRPQMKAILMSGYTERLEVEEKEATSFTFLQKPFTVEVLASTLRKVISGN